MLMVVMGDGDGDHERRKKEWTVVMLPRVSQFVESKLSRQIIWPRVSQMKPILLS